MLSREITRPIVARTAESGKKRLFNKCRRKKWQQIRRKKWQQIRVKVGRTGWMLTCLLKQRWGLWNFWTCPLDSLQGRKRRANFVNKGGSCFDRFSQVIGAFLNVNFMSPKGLQNYINMQRMASQYPAISVFISALRVYLLYVCGQYCHVTQQMVGVTREDGDPLPVIFINI